MKKITKNSPLPLYYQLKENILDSIKNKEFEVGEKLPSERELAEYHNISRMTVKKAVDILVDDNYLIRKQGRGTFISNYKQSYSISPLLSFSQEMQAKGLNYKSKILNFSIINNEEIAKKMDLAKKEKIYQLKRLRIIEGQPFLLENTYLAKNNFKNLNEKELKNNSLYKIMQDNYNIKLKNAEAQVEAVILNAKTAAEMKVKEGMLALYFEQFSRDSENKIIEYTSAYYRNDNYKFKFNFDLN